MRGGLGRARTGAATPIARTERRIPSVAGPVVGSERADAVSAGDAPAGALERRDDRPGPALFRGSGLGPLLRAGPIWPAHLRRILGRDGQQDHANLALGTAPGHAATTQPELPGPAIHPIRRTLRYWFARITTWILVRAFLRISFEGRERIPRGPVVMCFNHLNWADPFVLMGILPFRPRLYFFGPKEEDMGSGARNRLMAWVGTAVPYRPGKNDLLEATRRVQRLFDAGGRMAIAGEGRIHAGERELLPLNEGAAYFALRAGVPLVPIAINGTSWLGFGRRIRVRAGEPIIVARGTTTREAVSTATEALAVALARLVSDAPEQPPPGPFGRWLTELFNDWPEGERPAPREGRVEPLAVQHESATAGRPL